MLRIALVTPGFPPSLGGVETHVGELAGGLARRGHDVTVFTRGPRTAQEVIDGVSIRRFAARSRHYAVMPRLWSELRHGMEEFDVVHAHSYHALPALAVAMARPQAFVFTPHYHGTGHSRLRRTLHVPYRRIGARIFAEADAVVCVSDAEANLVRDMFPEAASRISVISNGVDVEEIGAASPRPVDGTLVLVSGRIEKYKQVDRVVDAVAHLQPRFVLSITGDGEELHKLQVHTRENGLADRVRFLGRLPRDEYLQWLRAASVFVTMSRREAQGIVVLESLAAEVPVVASDIPAHREIAERAPGWVRLVPVDSSARDLAEAISIATDSGEGVSPCAPVPWTQVVDMTLALYERVLAADAPNRATQRFA